MQKDRIYRALLVVPILVVIAIFYSNSMHKKMMQIKKDTAGGLEPGTVVQGQFVVKDKAGEVHWFTMGSPYPVGRSSARPLTRVETSAGILPASAHPPTVESISIANFSGLALLVDLSSLDASGGRSIGWEDLRPHLEKNEYPITMLAIKTRASLLPQDYDFSGKGFITLSGEAARGIHDYGSTIRCLITDLPAIDGNDPKNQSARRAFFGLSADRQADAFDNERRVILESAWFQDYPAGYYYVTITPPRFPVASVATGIVLYPLL